MTPGVRPLVAGNWKMNGLSGSLAEIDAMRQAADAGESGLAELLVCPPATLLAQAAWRIKGGELSLGAQDCHPVASGAFTGDISAPMLKDAGATYVILGHSERRTLHHETDALVRAKVEAALSAGLVPIVCVGETKTEREFGRCDGGRPAATSGLAAAERRAGNFGRCLRADLGDRNRAHPDACGRRGNASGDPDAARRNVWRARTADAPSLRGLGQAEQLRRAFDPRQCRRRAGRRGEPESDGISGHRRRLSLTAISRSVPMDAPLAPC